MSWRQECSIGGDKKSRSVDCPRAGRSIGIAIEARDRYDRALYSRDGAHERIVLNRRIGGSNSAYGGDSYKQPEANGPASTQAGGTLIHPNHPAASSRYHRQSSIGILTGDHGNLNEIRAFSATTAHPVPIFLVSAF
jgi:hypothetical protein